MQLEDQAVGEVTPAEAIDTIHKAFQAGHPIVPLFGSGMSVAAGFPLAATLCNYLVRLTWWLRERKLGSVASYLRTHAWPSRHDLTADLLCLFRANATADQEAHWPISFVRRLEKEEYDLNREALLDELRRDAPTASYALKAVFEKAFKPAADGRRPPRRWAAVDRATGRVDGYTGYRSLLNYLCDRDGDLIDAFFDHFARDRRLSTTHQFIAFVTRLLGCRLILTTNFDTFVESALREEGMRPTVYEIGREGAPPSAQLVHSQSMAVVKLHGGAFSLRTGFDLDERLSAGVLAQYRDYFRPPTGKPPLVVAIGYSGSDRRVMDILGTHLAGTDPADAAGGVPRILWVSRRGGSPPPHLTELALPFARGKAKPVVQCVYRDGGSFLHEVYQAISGQHPVGRHHYRVLTPIVRDPKARPGYLTDAKPAAAGRAVHAGRGGSAGAKGFDPVLATHREFQNRYMPRHRGLLLHAPRSRSGSSSLMAKACELLERRNTTIWIDAAEVRTRASLFMAIERSFHPYDRRLPRMTRPLLCSDVDLLDPCPRDKNGVPATAVATAVVAGDEEPPERWIERQEIRGAVSWIGYALRRSRYTLAVDSLGEFADEHPAVREDLPSRVHARDQKTKALELLCELTADAVEVGESKLLMTFVGAGTPDDREPPAVLYDPMRSGHAGFKAALLPPPTADPEAAAAHFADLCAPPEASATDKWLTAAAEYREQVRALVVLLASFARRGRSFVSLVSLLQRVVDCCGKTSAGPFRVLLDAYGSPDWCLLTIGRGGNDQPAAAAPDEAARAMAAGQPWPSPARRAALAVEAAVATEAATGRTGDPFAFLLHADGGFYWMHQATRDDVFNHATRAAASGPPPMLDEATVALIFDQMADVCHEDLYETSQDAAAFMEYFFHRLMSVQWQPAADADPTGRALRLRRAKWLVVAIELEREKLLARGRSTTLLNHIRDFLSALITLAGRATGADVRAASDLADREAGDPVDYVPLLGRVLGSYAELLVSLGHAARAVPYRLLQVRVLAFQADPYRGGTDAIPARRPFADLWAEWSGEAGGVQQHGIGGPGGAVDGAIASLIRLNRWLKAEAAISCGTAKVPNCRGIVGLLRQGVDLMTDLAVTLGDPMLFDAERHRELYGKEQAWETADERRVRLRWVPRLFGWARHRAVDLGRLAASRVDADRLTRARIRRIEYDLRMGDKWLRQFICVGPGTPPPRPRAREATHERGLWRLLDQCRAVLQSVRAGPDSPRRRRHKCYLYVQMARTYSFLGQFEEAEVHFGRAIAALTRSAGAAERNALGVVYLFHAEIMLGRATLGATGKDVDARRIERVRQFQQCELLLSQAMESLEDEARTENRWHTFFHFLSARLSLERIRRLELAGEPLDVARFEAMRHVVAGTINTGFRDDHRAAFHGLMREVCAEILEAETAAGIEAADVPPDWDHRRERFRDPAEAEEERQERRLDRPFGPLLPAARLAQREMARSKVRDLRERAGLPRARQKADADFFEKCVRNRSATASPVTAVAVAAGSVRTVPLAQRAAAAPHGTQTVTGAKPDEGDQSRPLGQDLAGDKRPSVDGNKPVAPREARRDEQQI